MALPLEAAIVRVDADSGSYGQLTVSRDAEYRLAVALSVEGTASWFDERLEGKPGTISEGFEIEAVEAPNVTVVLPNAVVASTSLSFGDQGAKTSVVIVAHRLSRTYPSAASPQLLVDWFISGPDRSLTFWRVTRRTHSESFTRTRRGLTKDGSDHEFSCGLPPGGTSVNSSRDYLALELPAGTVRVCLVPKENSPQWSRPLAIEYPILDGEPAEAVRDGVVEALGFMFGRHILQVGTTVFDGSGRPVRDVAISPWGRDVIGVSSRSDLPPTPLFSFEKGSQAEALLTPIVVAYLNARDELNLSHVVWTTWIALRMPVTFETPLYASALETLMKAWFASKRSKTGGVYMPTKQFRKTFSDALKSFERSATGIAYGDRIVRKVGRANEMGVNERLQLFFEELGLPVGVGEDAVIRSRHVAAHGGQSDRTAQDQMMLGNGYRTLVNRVLLKVLGYSGQYTDYSVVGHPERELDEPIGYRAPETHPSES